MKSCYLFFVLILMGLILHSEITNGQYKPTTFNLKQYGAKDGLRQNSIWGMTMDQDRYLWLSTEGGLVRFDGRDFKIFNSENTPGITSNRFRLIHKALNGSLYAGNIDDNIFEIREGSIFRINPKDPPTSSKYWVEGIVPDAEFLVGIAKNIQNLFRDEEQQPLIVMLPYKENEYLMTIKKGFRLFDRKSNKRIKDIILQEFKSIEPFTIGSNVYFFDDKKILYMLHVENGTCTKIDYQTTDLTAEDLKTFNPSNHVIWNPICNEIYLHINQKLFGIKQTNQENKVSVFPIINNLPTNIKISSVLYDSKSRTYFISSTTKGLLMYRQHSISTSITKDLSNVNANCFYALTDIDSNTVFAGWDKEFTISGAQNLRFKLGSKTVLALAKNRSGELYYPADGILKKVNLSTGSIQIIDTTSRSFYYMYSTGDTIFVSCDYGLAGIANDQLILLKKIEQPYIGARIVSITDYGTNTLLLGTGNGIYNYNRTTRATQLIKGTEGLAVRNFSILYGKTFFGTYGQGYYCFDKSKIVKMPLDDNRHLNFIHNISMDNNSNVWISTNGGLFCTNYRYLFNHLKDSTKNIDYYYFDEQDGLLNREMNGGCIPSSIRLKNGFVAYPTMEGIAWIQPEKAPLDNPTETIRFDYVSVNSERIPLKDTIVLMSGKNKIYIEFSTPYWSNQENVKIEYKLFGLNDEWSPTEANGRWVDFENLDPGTYKLMIRKHLIDDKNDYIYSAITIIVKPSYYESWVFRLSITLASILLIALGFYYNNYRIVRQNRLLESRIKERTKALTGSNKELADKVMLLAEKEKNLRQAVKIKEKLISILSHDIITPIKFLSIVSNASSETEKSEPINSIEIKENMKYIGVAAEKIYNNATNILNWMKLQNELIRVNKQHIALHEFVDEIIEPFRNIIDKSKITIKNNIQEETIIVSDPYILNILLQNIISNSLKYTKEGSVEIFFREDESKKRIIEVRDTGIGMPEKIINKIKAIRERSTSGEFEADDPDTGNQLGYYIIYDFSRMLNIETEIDSQQDKGTTVRMTLSSLQ